MTGNPREEYFVCDKHNIHFGNQFSSREKWIPTSRHAVQVHFPSFGMCCMMTTVTTYISGTNSHLEKSGSPISRASLHGHTSIFNRKSKRHLSLPFSEGLTLCHNSKLGKILLLPRAIHVISLATKRQMKFMLSLPTAGNFVHKQGDRKSVV